MKERRIDFRKISETDKPLLYQFFIKEQAGEFSNRSLGVYTFSYQEENYEIHFEQNCLRSIDDQEKIIQDELFFFAMKPFRDEPEEIFNKNNVRLSRKNYHVIAHVKLNYQTNSIDILQTFIDSTNTPLQIKFRDTYLTAKTQDDPVCLKHFGRLAREADIYQKLYGFGKRLYSKKSRACVVSCVPFFPGEELEFKIKHLDAHNIRTIIFDIIRLMLLLHSHNYIHVDLNISNIIIDSTNHAKLIDFDLSRKKGEKCSLNTGTTDSMAPEMLFPHCKDLTPSLIIDEKIDYFSLAIVLLQMLLKYIYVNFYCNEQQLVAHFKLTPILNDQSNTHYYRIPGKDKDLFSFHEKNFIFDSSYQFELKDKELLTDIIINLAQKDPNQRKLTHWSNTAALGFWSSAQPKLKENIENIADECQTCLI